MNEMTIAVVFNLVGFVAFGVWVLWQARRDAHRKHYNIQPRRNIRRSMRKKV